MNRIKVSDINDTYWVNAQLELRRGIGGWIHGAIWRQEDIPWRGGHDEGSYTCSWTKFYRLTGDKITKDFLYWLRDSFRQWSEENQYHGFQAEPKEHSNHSFENAEEFLTDLSEMEPENETNTLLIEDVAHHVGNWVEGIPEWYDWKRHRFLSHWVGTKGVKNQPPDDFELAGHSRIGTIVLQTYKVTRNERYLEWCKDYASKWVDTIMSSTDRIPMVTYGTEYEDPEKREEVYNSGSEKVGDPYIGNIWKTVTRHAVNFLLKVYELVKEPRYLEAVRKAIQIYENANVSERYMLGLYMNYYNYTGENFYKDKLDAWYDNNIKPELNVKQMLPNTMILTKKRNGMHDIGEDNKNVYQGPARNFGTNDIYGNVSLYRGPSPSEYVTGYKVSGDIECLKRAMALATCELFLTAYSTRDGKDHGCEGHRYIHGAGEEAVDALSEATGIDMINYYKEDNAFGLEEQVAVFFDYQDGDDVISLYFYNDNEEDKIIKVGMRDDTAKIKKVTAEGTSANINDGLAEIKLAPKQVIKVDLSL